MASRNVSFHTDVPLEDRLAVIQREVRKTTEEALKQISSSTSSTAGASPTAGGGLASPQHKDPNASFNLGMELFGQDVQKVQRNIRDRLDQVEKELGDIKNQLSRQAISPYEQDEQENIPVDEIANKSKDTLQKEANLLSKKINFLRQCSMARSLLDEAITFSKPALTAEPDWVDAARKLAKSEEALVEAQQLLTSNKEDSTTGDSLALQAAYKIIDSIRASIRRERVDLIDRAKNLFDICVTFSENGMAVRGSKAAKTASTATARQGLEGVYDVLEAMSTEEANSALRDTLRRFTLKLYRQVFQPVLEDMSKKKVPGANYISKRKWTVQETTDENDSTLRTGRIKVKGPVHRLEWEKVESKDESGDAKGSLSKEMLTLENWKQALDFFHQCVVFVREYVLLGRKSLCLKVGKQLFGRPDALPSSLNLEALGLESIMIGNNDNGLVMENLVEALAQTCIPDKNLKPEEMPKLQSLAEELRSFTHPFVQTLVEMEFITLSDSSLDDNSFTRLEAFSTNFEQKYIDNRRATILNEARNLLLKNDYHNMVTVGVDVQSKKEKSQALQGMDDGMAVFELHKSSVSDTASKLMKLCRVAMDEAVEHAGKRNVDDKDTPLALLAPTLYRAARESLDLFRAIIPATHGNEIANLPRTAAVFHNDCVFFQYHCLWLGLEYKSKLPPQPKETDDARGTLFHQACMFVDMVPLFRELADKSMGEMLDRQTHQMVEIVGKRITLFGQALRSDEILAEWSEAETALNAGLYHLRHLSETWGAILSHDVFVRSIGHLADALFTLYLEQVTNAKDISESACHFVSSLFQNATSAISELLKGDKSGSLVWDRFEAVGRFMDMRLMDIQTGLADGVFRSVTAPELSRLITATFADSPKRQRFLQALSSQ